MPNTDLVRLLNSVGKSTFVSFFNEFADTSLTNQDVVAILPEQYTLKARNTRVSKARRILREGLAEEALELICASERVDPETAKQARELLRKLRSSK
ncbi:MAG: hypothetical protein WAM70_06510 [Pyrinomonadaceae bacterium]